MGVGGCRYGYGDGWVGGWVMLIVLGASSGCYG